MKHNKIIPFEDLIKQDKANIVFSSITTDYLQKVLLNPPIQKQVPEDVKKHIEVAKKLCVYGYFQYSFFTVSYFWVLLAIEIGLKRKFIDFYYNKEIELVKKGKNKKVTVNSKSFEHLYKKYLRDKWQIKEGDKKYNGGLTSLIQWAEDKGFLKIDNKKQIITDTLKRARNYFAHPERNTVYLPGTAITGVQDVINIVNELFSK